MSELKKLFIELITSVVNYIVIVGKITVKIIQILNNRTVMVGAITQAEHWLVELRQEMLETKKKPITILGKKIKTISKSLEKEFRGFENVFQEPTELVDVEKEIGEELFDPRARYESKTEARDLMERNLGWVGYTWKQWFEICDAVAEDYPSLTNAAQAAKAGCPVQTETVS